MKTVSFTGKSGTGKSYQATALAQRRGFDAIIDDGLLIYKGQIVAGTSAKKCATKAAAMRAALFNVEEQRDAVIAAIENCRPNVIMIIGTSDRMTDIIADQLGISRPEERIYIEDVSTAEERKLAAHYRIDEGEHVIPAPLGQLRRDFAGYFMNPEMLIRRAKDMTDKAQEAIKNPAAFLQRGKNTEVAKTVVRPTYSYLGDFLISDKVVRDIASLVGKEVDGVNKVVSVYENTEPDNLKLVIVLDLDREKNVWEVAEKFQRRLAQVIENMTAFNVVSTDIEIRQLV